MKHKPLEIHTAGGRYPSDDYPRISVRLQPNVAKAFRESLIDNERSQSAEINYVLKKHYKV